MALEGIDADAIVEKVKKMIIVILENFMKIKLLFCLMVFQSAILLGMEPAKSGNKVIEGSILIDINKPMRYMYLKPYNDGSSEKTRLELVLNIKLQKNTPVVLVWAYHDKSNTSSWSNIYYGKFSKIHQKRTKNVAGEPEKEKQGLLREEYANTFPRYLPVLLFSGKEKGDTVEFEVCGLPVKLKCEQLPRRYEENHDGTPVQFHEVLKQLKTSFRKNPVFHWADEEILIEEGIIVKTESIDKDGNYIYQHGKNGYRENDTQKSQKN